MRSPLTLSLKDVYGLLRLVGAINAFRSLVLRAPSSTRGRYPLRETTSWSGLSPYGGATPVVGLEGFEPPPTDSESVVLPLDDRPMYNYTSQAA